MKVYFLSLVLMCSSLLCFGHGGEDHGETKAQTKQTGKTYFTVNSISEIFEIVFRYEPIKPKEKAVMKLFLADFDTNIAIDKATIDISVVDYPDLKFSVTSSEAGIYLVEGVFPEEKKYNLIANISKGESSDLMLIEEVTVGQDLISEQPHAKGIFDGELIYVFAIGMAIGIVFTWLLVFIANKTKNKKSV